MATLHFVLILAALTSFPVSLTLQTKTGEDAEHMLTIIHDITTNNIGSLCYHNTYKSIKFHIDTEIFKNSKEKAELVRDFLMDSETYEDNDISIVILKNLLFNENEIKAGRILTF